MAAFGASCPFPWVLANVPSPNRQRPLALGGENRSRCGPMCAIAPGSASSEVNSWCHHAQPRAARAVPVEEPRYLSARLPWLAAVTGSPGSRPAITSKIATAAGSRGVRPRLCSSRPAASAACRDRTQISSDAFRTFGPPSAAFLKKHNYLIPWATSVVVRTFSRLALQSRAANSSNPLRNYAAASL